MDYKYCKDCKHFDQGFIYHVCNAPQLKRPPDLVTGVVETRFCSTQRMFSHNVVPSVCGSEGQFFEAKDAPAITPV